MLPADPIIYLALLNLSISGAILYRPVKFSVDYHCFRDNNPPDETPEFTL